MWGTSVPYVTRRSILVFNVNNVRAIFVASIGINVLVMKR